MPRYFFDVHDGVDLFDDEGTELPDPKAARAHAVRYAAALLMDVGETFWDGGDWSMEVTDADRLRLFTLHFVISHSPATTDR